MDRFAASIPTARRLSSSFDFPNSRSRAFSDGRRLTTVYTVKLRNKSAARLMNAILSNKGNAPKRVYPTQVKNGYRLESSQNHLPRVTRHWPKTNRTRYERDNDQGAPMIRILCLALNRSLLVIFCSTICPLPIVCIVFHRWFGPFFTSVF